MPDLITFIISVAPLHSSPSFHSCPTRVHLLCSILSYFLFKYLTSCQPLFTILQWFSLKHLVKSSKPFLIWSYLNPSLISCHLPPYLWNYSTHTGIFPLHKASWLLFHGLYTDYSICLKCCPLLPSPHGRLLLLPKVLFKAHFLGDINSDHSIKCSHLPIIINYPVIFPA